MTIDVSIVIVNFNTPTTTINCLRSIFSYTKNITYEIILVDNAPTIDHLISFKSVIPELIYIKSAVNVGFGVANNIGIAQCKGKYILLLNSDTLLIENALKSCVEFMEIQPTFGLLGCKLLNKDLSYQGSFYPFNGNSLKQFILGNNYILYKLFNIKEDFNEPFELKEVGDISGAFMFFRSTIIQQTKGFDPDFFLYCEESEWCRERITKISKIAYYPYTKVIHLGGQSAPRDFMFIQSKLSLFLMWYKKGILSYLVFILLAYMNVIFNTLMYPLVNKAIKREIRLALKAYIHTVPYLFNDIMKFQKKWGSRTYPLIYKKARFIFFPNETK